MSVKFSNNGHSTLAASITTSATSLTVASGHGARFPSLSSGEYFYATLIDSSNNLEIVKVTARSSDVLTVTRAQESTTARAYAIGDRIELRVTAAGIADATNIDNIVPDQSSHSGKFITTDGTNVSWGAVNLTNISATSVSSDTFSVGSVQTKPLFQIINIDSATSTVISNTSFNAINGTEATVTISKANTLRQYLVQIPGEIDSNAGNVFAQVYRKVDSGSYAAASSVTNLNFAVGATNGTVNSVVHYIDTQTYNAGQVIKYKVYVRVGNSGSNLELGQNNLSGNTNVDNNMQGFLMEYDNS